MWDLSPFEDAAQKRSLLKGTYQSTGSSDVTDLS
jgi:hypothetical protein